MLPQREPSMVEEFKLFCPSLAYMAPFKAGWGEALCCRRLSGTFIPHILMFPSLPHIQVILLTPIRGDNPLPP